MRTKKRVEIKKFNNFEINSNDVVVNNFYNYSPTRTLKNSSGIKVATFPINSTDSSEYVLDFNSAGITGVDGIAYFKQYFSHNGKTTHRLLVYGTDKKVYINQMLDDTDALFWLYDLTFSSPPITLSYKKDDADAIILASKDEMKIWKTNYSPYTISNVPIITSMCMNAGVLFCTIKEPAFKIWYATDLDAENIGAIGSNSGYISLEDDLGYARKIITFNEDVFVFRDYGITKINYIKGEVTYNQIYLSGTKIYTNTVSVSGNVVMFLAKDGLYSFNGVKVSKMDVVLNNISLENDSAVASSLASKYYIALRLIYNDGNKILCENTNYVNNAIIIIDTTDFSFEIIRGADIKNFLPIKTEEFEKMLVIFNTVHNDKIGEITSSPLCIENTLPKLWISEQINNSPNTKLFTKLSVYAEKGVKFKLIYDNGKEQSFTTYVDGLNEFMFKIICKEIKLEISSNNESGTVQKVYLDYYEY